MQHQRKQTLRDDELDPALSEVSRTVIGCAIEIHKTLGPGFSRDAYVRALSVELKGHNVDHSVDHEFDLTYKDEKIGSHRVGLYVDGRFVVQVFAEDRDVSGFDRDALRAQLRAADLDLGLIINFDRRRLRDGLVRVLNPDRIDSLRGSDEHHHDDEGEDGA
ncbi:MAG: GxxExxY protein [Planctomycetota bacterium]